MLFLERAIISGLSHKNTGVLKFTEEEMCHPGDTKSRFMLFYVEIISSTVTQNYTNILTVHTTT